MRKSRFSETEIVTLLKQADAGVPVKDLCRQAGISTATYYQWKSKFGGLEASELKRVRELEAENAKLKRMYAELALDNAAMKDLIARRLQGRRSGARRPVALSGSTSAPFAERSSASACPNQPGTRHRWTGRCAMRRWPPCCASGSRSGPPEG